MKDNNIITSYKDIIFKNNNINNNIDTDSNIELYNSENINNSDIINNDIIKDNNNINTNNTKMQQPINKHSLPRKMKLEKIDINVIIQTLEENGGLLTQTAEKLGVTRQCLARFINRFPSEEINQAIFHGREKFLDRCEKKLSEHVESFDSKISLDAVKFALSTIGKDRGFTTSANIEIDANISAIAPDIDKIAAAAKKLDDVIDIEIDED